MRALSLSKGRRRVKKAPERGPFDKLRDRLGFCDSSSMSRDCEGAAPRGRAPNAGHPGEAWVVLTR